MKIVIIGAGSMAFPPALLAGFSADRRYVDLELGLVDVNEQALDVVDRFARRVSDEFDLRWWSRLPQSDTMCLRGRTW